MPFVITKGFNLGKVVGKKTADLATTCGSIETFALDKTGFVTDFPKAHIIRPPGDKKPDGVVPDISIPTPTDLQAEDVVLNQLIERIRRDDKDQ
jgi:hypothetical protein